MMVKFTAIDLKFTRINSISQLHIFHILRICLLSIGLGQEVLLPYEPHGPFELALWSPGKANLA